MSPETIFDTQIRPSLFRPSKKTDTPVTVFLGGQPGAGKTRAQRHILKLYGESSIIPIVGDDFRQYHPDYRRFLKDDPIHMPDATAKLAGLWTGMAVDYADTHGYGCIIEGTWRNAKTVLNEVERAKRLDRGTHAVLVTTPADVSLLGILSRFYRDMEEGRRARWTPPTAHEITIRNLPDTVDQVASSPLFDRYTVQTRESVILYDGTDGNAFRQAWRDGFYRPLSDDEQSFMESELADLADLHQRFTPDVADAAGLIRRLREDLMFDAFEDMPVERHPQPREPKGTPRGGQWTH